MPKLGLYKSLHHITIPKLATKGSACFDIHACVKGSLPPIKGFDSKNNPIERKERLQDFVDVLPGDRLMIPTGLIMDIPEGYSVRLHPRSGTSLKKGLVLANLEGVIDSDYVEEVKILIHNTSEAVVRIEDGERIVQAELVKNVQVELINIEEAPEQKTERTGGFGSTGEK